MASSELYANLDFWCKCKVNLLLKIHRMSHAQEQPNSSSLPLPLEPLNPTSPLPNPTSRLNSLITHSFSHYSPHLSWIQYKLLQMLLHQSLEGNASFMECLSNFLLLFCFRPCWLLPRYSRVLGNYRTKF